MTNSLEVKLQSKMKVMQIYMLLKILSEPDQTEESEDNPEAEPTWEVQDEVPFDEAQDSSQQANQSKNTFKYKSSHLEDQFLSVI